MSEARAYQLEVMRKARALYVLGLIVIAYETDDRYHFYTTPYGDRFYALYDAGVPFDDALEQARLPYVAKEVP